MQNSFSSPTLLYCSSGDQQNDTHLDLMTYILMMMTTKTMTHTLLSNDDKSISSADGQPSKLAFLCPSLLITRYHRLNVVLLKNSSAHHNNNNNEIIIMASFDPPHNYNPLPPLLLLCVLSPFDVPVVHSAPTLNRSMYYVGIPPPLSSSSRLQTHTINLLPLQIPPLPLCHCCVNVYCFLHIIIIIIIIIYYDLHTLID